jgi:hypothetical protein
MIKVLLKRILHPFFPFKSRKRKQRPDREVRKSVERAAHSAIQGRFNKQFRTGFKS